MEKAIYITSYDETGRTVYGAFQSVEFCSVNTSYPKVKNDTVTYSVQKPDGEYDKVTVSMVHTIHSEPTETETPTVEAIITGKSGATIIIHRYGADDYSAWWTDEKHMNDETYGYSVRGTLFHIMNEIKNELEE